MYGSEVMYIEVMIISYIGLDSMVFRVFWRICRQFFILGLGLGGCVGVFW